MKPIKSRTHSFHLSTMAAAFLSAGVVTDAPMIRSPKATIDPKKGRKRGLSVHTPGAFGKEKVS